MPPRHDNDMTRTERTFFPLHVGPLIVDEHVCRSAKLALPRARHRFTVRSRAARRDRGGWPGQ
jgi:hypothetical protein